MKQECKDCVEYGSEFCKDCLKEELGMTAASAGIPHDTKDMGPKNVTDKRRRKDRPPVVLKRFRKYMDDK